MTGILTKGGKFGHKDTQGDLGHMKTETWTQREESHIITGRDWSCADTSQECLVLTEGRKGKKHSSQSEGGFRENTILLHLNFRLPELEL